MSHVAVPVPSPLKWRTPCTLNKTRELGPVGVKSGLKPDAVEMQLASPEKPYWPFNIGGAENAAVAEKQSSEATLIAAKTGNTRGFMAVSLFVCFCSGSSQNISSATPKPEAI